MTIGVLLEAFGALSTLDDVEAYLQRITGRTPSPDETAALRQRFEAIGGPGPLAENTRRQAEALQAALGPGFRVALGMRNSQPSLAEVAQGLAASGVERIVAIALAPQYSSLSVERYHEAARSGLERVLHRPPVTFVRSYACHPQLAAYWSDAIRHAATRLAGDVEQGYHVLATFHGLPRTVEETGDPYPEECRATGAAIAETLGTDDWSIAYQSGRAGWLGPDVAQRLDALTRSGTRRVVLAPAGFVAEHLETLFDLDGEALPHARNAGLSVERAEAPNDAPLFILALADTVRRHLD